MNNNENNINQEEESTKEAQEWLNFASDSFVGQSLRVNKSTSLSTFTKQQINSMLLNPALNYEKLQNLSQLYLTKNGVYKRLIEYFAYILSFDTLLVPRTETSNIKNKSKMIKSFESSALYLEMLNPKTNLPIWSKELFTNGEIFLYKIQDSKSIEFKQIPNKYCLPCAKTESVYRYVIDMQKFVSGEDATSYPKEIQKAVEMYNSDSKGKLIDGQYYEVSNKGVCFTFNGGKGGHAIPPFSSLFTDLVNLDENKTLQNQINRLENTKMIHNKIPLNKESKPIVDPELAKRYNQAIKQNLDEGIFSIVNPFESEVLNLNNNTQKTNTLVDEAISQIFNSSGVSNLIFNNNKASGEALVKSIKADVAILVNGLIPLFSDYLSWELSQLEKTMNYKVLIMPFTIFDREEIRSKASAELAFGGSRFYYFSTLGLSPLQTMNLLKMEQAIGIDSLLVPAQSSHTQSDKGGRPANNEQGIPLSDITDSQNESQG